jgi:membrane-associated phospholipid phosphatase
MARRYAAAFGLALAAAVATEAASRVIVSDFADRPVAPDLLFRLLPQVPQASYVTLVAMAAMLTLFALYAIRCESHRLPEFIAVIAVMYMLRAPLLVLTPLAADRASSLVTFPLFVYGLFPSGHTALAVLLVAFTDRKLAPGVHIAQIALAWVVVIGMLLSRVHYSIDIAGGLLLAYFIGREWERGTLFAPLKRLVTAAYAPSGPA